MKRTPSKFLSLLLSLTLLFGLCVPSVYATAGRYTDIQGHWAKNSIERWSDYGIISGYGDGLFGPNDSITRAQMAALLARLLALPQADSAGFTDVAEDAWYAEAINRCYAAGIMAGNDGKAMPNTPISREQAMTMLCRSLDIEAKSDVDLSTYTDVGEVSSYAIGYVAAMVESGIVKGTSASTLSPKANITRASIVAILDRGIAVYANETNSIVDAADVDGLILIVASNVTVTNAPTGASVFVCETATGTTVNGKAVSAGFNYAIGEKVQTTKPTTSSGSSGGSSGGGSSTPVYSDLTISTEKTIGGGTYQNVTITADVGDGEVTLSNMIIRGNLTVQGGGSGSVKLTNCTVGGKVLMDKTINETSTQRPRLELTNTTIATVEVKQPAILEATDSNSDIIAVQAVADLEIKGENTTISTVTIPANAEKIVIVSVTGGTVATVKAQSGTEVSGAGTVSTVVATATVNVNSATVEKVEVPVEAEDIVVNITGESEISVEVNSDSTTITADNAEKVVVSGSSEDVSVHVHNWGNGVATKEATCTTKGEMLYTCNGCEATKTEDIAVLGHNFSSEYSNDETGHWHVCTREGCGVTDEKAMHVYNIANCTEAATCTVCYYQKTAGEHTWNEGSITTQPTCTEKGEKVYTCTVCGTPKTEDVEKTGHAWGDWVKYDEENHKRICTNDNSHTETATHTWDAGKVTVEATETAEGEILYTCGDCGATKTETIPMVSNKVSLLPTNIKLAYTKATGLTLTMTKPEDISLINSDGISLIYDVNDGNQTLKRSINPSIVSTAFLTNYDLLQSGENTIVITFTAVPTEAATAAGYETETTTFTATITYAEEIPDFNAEDIQTSFGEAIDSSGTVIEGKKQLTITGLKANQSYFVTVQVGADGATANRQFTTDGNGVGSSEWFTNYEFSQCTISEWDVEDVTENSANITRRDYEGTFIFPTNG